MMSEVTEVDSALAPVDIRIVALQPRRAKYNWMSWRVDDVEAELLGAQASFDLDRERAGSNIAVL